MKPIIVYDSDHFGAVENKCFSKEFANKGPGHDLTVELAIQAAGKGISIMTADIFLKNKFDKDTIALCITDMYSRNTNAVIRRGAVPFLCYSLESPLIAKSFYTNIEKLAGRFIHNIQFSETASRLLKTNTHFSTMYFPVTGRMPLTPMNWKEKKYLVLINSNKRIFRTDNSNLKEITRSILSKVKLAALKRMDPWMRYKEIYTERIEILKYFSRYQDFELYGIGWENRISGFSQDYHRAALKVFKGPVSYQDKLELMNQFKFNICFENCDFPGYVTEKIFDCFLSACIPVYYGPSNIDQFVPRNTYIDYRRFKGPAELDSYLRNFTEDEGKEMLDAAKRFLDSKDFDKYYLKNFVQTIINKVNKYSID